MPILRRNMNHADLVTYAAHLRRKTFRAFLEHGEAHLGGSFSMIEALIVLYEVVLRPSDKFILSKAHASFPLCLLLQEKGLAPELKTHLEIDPENGIHATTGSLGHGLPIATGMAFAKKNLRKSLRPKWIRCLGYFAPRGGIPIDVFWQSASPPKNICLPEIKTSLFNVNRLGN